MNRPTLITLLAGAALATTACSDRPNPMAPESPMLADAASVSAIQADDAADVSDLDDLLGRIVPALGDHPAVGRLAQTLRQLRNEHRASPAVGSALDRATDALEELERESDPALAADLGVVRLVIEARR